MFNVQSFLRSHFTVLIHHTMDTPFLHSFTIVNMLRRKLTIAFTQHFHQQQGHSSSKESDTYQYCFYHFGCKGKKNN